MMKVNKMGTALITGASSGIGAVYAERLANRGYDLILVARDKDKLEALAQDLTSSTGRSVDTLKADLTNPAELRLIEQLLVDDTDISMLVNNAGLGATRSLIDSSLASLEELVQINILALTRLARAVAPAMAQRGSGTIVNISSGVALAPEMLNGVYSASKAYVLAFTQSLSLELVPKGLRIQVVLPGATGTPFWQRAGLPLDNLPNDAVMNVEDLVDAALAGLDMGETVTIPSLPELADWENFETARKLLAPNLSRRIPAPRYQT